ncbi:hypothetical protein [Candidatus Cyrtobacter comes]|nr:hypothetical protein [Candidatus Cyrtobacter comes]
MYWLLFSVFVIGLLLVNFSAIYLHRGSVVSFFEKSQEIARKNGNELVMKDIIIEGFLGWKPGFSLRGIEFTSSNASNKTIVDFGDIYVSEDIFNKKLIITLKNDIRISYPSDDDKCCMIVNFLGKRPEMEFLFSTSLDTILKETNLDDRNSPMLKYIEKFSYQDGGFELNIKKHDELFTKAMESQGYSVQFNTEGDTSTFEMKLGKSRYFPEGSSGIYPDIFKKLGDITFDMKARKVLNMKTESAPDNTNANQDSNDFIEIAPVNFNSDLFYVHSKLSISRQRIGAPAYSYADITIGNKKEAFEFLVDVMKHVGLDSTKYSTSEIAKMISGFFENLPESKLEGDELTIRITVNDSGHVLVSGLDMTALLELFENSALSEIASSLQLHK